MITRIEKKQKKGKNEMDITYDQLKDILEKHKIWLRGGEGGCRANLSGADLSGANLDYSAWPIWCGSLTAEVDDRLVAQLLYHILSVVKYSENVSKGLKEALLTRGNLEQALKFHKARECQKLYMEDAKDGN